MLMEALEGCDNLRVLELGYNPFGEEGIKAIADVMKYKLQVRHAAKHPSANLTQFTSQRTTVAS
jgi:Ran GTPase-activating protein (RanGAP) involved in mRNA processing and transport